MGLTEKFPSEVSSPSAIRPDYLSPSSVKSYLSCSLRFFLERVAQIRKPTTVALHVGKTIHAALQSFNLARWRGEDSNEAAMEEAFSAHFLELEKAEGPVGYADEETRQKVRSCAWNTVKAYMASDEVASQMPLGVEVGLFGSHPRPAGSRARRHRPRPARLDGSGLQVRYRQTGYRVRRLRSRASASYLPDDDRRSDGRHASVAGSDLPAQDEDASSTSSQDPTC